MEHLHNIRLPAGWYPDPDGADHRRWWDGTTWTQHTAPFQRPVVVYEVDDLAEYRAHAKAKDAAAVDSGIPAPRRIRTAARLGRSLAALAHKLPFGLPSTDASAEETSPESAAKKTAEKKPAEKKPAEKKPAEKKPAAKPSAKKSAATPAGTNQAAAKPSTQATDDSAAPEAPPTKKPAKSGTAKQPAKPTTRSNPLTGAISPRATGRHVR